VRRWGKFCKTVIHTKGPSKDKIISNDCEGGRWGLGLKVFVK